MIWSFHRFFLVQNRAYKFQHKRLQFQDWNCFIHPATAYKMQPHLIKLNRILQDVAACNKDRLHVKSCICMLHDAATCYNMRPRVIWCSRMLDIITCSLFLKHATACYNMPLHVITLIEEFKSATVKICPNLKIKTRNHVNNAVLVSLLLTLNVFHTFF